MTFHGAEWKQSIGWLNIPYLVKRLQELGIFPTTKKIPVYLIVKISQTNRHPSCSPAVVTTFSILKVVQN